MNLKSILKNSALSFTLIFFLIYTLVYSQSISKGVLLGIDLCVKLLIPSLFFFMVISMLIIRCGIAEKIGLFVHPITKFLFGLPGTAFPAFILGLIGGYPTGTRIVKTLLETKKITKDEAQKLFLFCFGSGPAFIITMVGGALLKNTFLGILMFLIQILSTLILGISLKFLSKKFVYHKTHSFKKNNVKISEAIVLSCTDAAETMLNMCSLIIVFSALISMLENFNFSNVFLKMFLEITSGSFEATKLGISPVILIFFLTFGGICVHFQILSIIRSNNETKLGISYLNFFICRLFCSSISAALLFLALKIFESKVTLVFLTNIQELPKASNYATIFGSFAIIFMCLNFCTSNSRFIEID